jgi:hypothetical protein
MLPALVEHAPSVAYELLVKLMGTHLISDYYMVLATSGGGALQGGADSLWSPSSEPAVLLDVTLWC